MELHCVVEYNFPKIIRPYADNEDAMSRVIARLQASQPSTTRWLVVIAGFLGQLIIGILVARDVGQPGVPALSLAPLAGDTTSCRVASIRPFTEAWLVGLQMGDRVRMDGVHLNCLADHVPVRTIVPLSDVLANVISPAVDRLSVALVGVALLLSVIGSAILLRAMHRPMARVSYGLFFCTSLLLCLLSIQRLNTLWASMLSFALIMVIPGCSATFVWLLSSSASPDQVAPYRRLLRYSPLLAAGGLVVVGMPLLWWWPSVRFAVFCIIGIYSGACIGIICWMFCWGLRQMQRHERSLARMVMIGVLCLLAQLVLRLPGGGDEVIEQSGLAILLPVPLAALPMAFGYAVFRHKLLGMVSLISRRLMRIVLWLLLASVFVIPCLVLLRFVALQMPLTTRGWLLLLVGWLLLSLWWFPMAWTKVRDMGDQVLYRDFYHYNRSLRELSAALTHLQGMEQVAAFVLPHLAHPLNATEAALLVRPSRETSDDTMRAAPWQIYRHPMVEQRLPTEKLLSAAQLALTRSSYPSDGLLVQDGLLLIALFAGELPAGFLCLGPKHNFEPYTRQDLSFLATLAAQLAVLEVNSRYLAQAQADAHHLAALSHRVVSTQEEERRHLARELHDEALQQAMLVVRQLADASTMTEVADVMPLTRSVVESLRHLCLELRPPLLDELGLEEALCWLAEQTRRRGQTSGKALHIRVEYDGADLSRLPADVELALYRVAQEALSNTIKHAGADSVVIRLRRSRYGTVALLIADDGQGFRQYQPTRDRLGLVGMHERMLAIGGRLQFRSVPGRGVAVRAVYTHPTSAFDEIESNRFSIAVL